MRQQQGGTLLGFILGLIVGLAVAPAVPEPSTVGLMLAGLGAVGFGLRRGRARAQA